MKLDDITFFQPDYPPYEKVKNPTDYVKSFLTMLFSDPFFQETLLDVRMELGISEKGLDNSKIRLTKNLFKMKDHRAVKYFIEYLISAYNLPEDYSFGLFLLIVYNAFFDTSRLLDAGIMYSAHKGDYESKMAEESKKNYGAIYIYSKITKKELLRWIDENWQYIASEMDLHLPEVPTAGAKYKNLYIAKKIDELKNSGKSYKQISDILSLEYLDNDQVSDVGWLKSTLSRYRNALKVYRDKIESNTSVTFDVTE